MDKPAVIVAEQFRGAGKMIYRGYIQDGGIVLAEKIDLPDGVEVRIEPVGAAPTTLAERFKNVIGQAQDLPSDLAAQHDHYLYGTPKK